MAVLNVVPNRLPGDAPAIVGCVAAPKPGTAHSCIASSERTAGGRRHQARATTSWPADAPGGRFANAGEPHSWSPAAHRSCSRDVDSLRLVRPRSVGVEQVGLWALEQLGLPALLTELGVNGALRTAATGAVVGRLAQPASERATHRWAAIAAASASCSASTSRPSARQLYRASDALVKHREGSRICSSGPWDCSTCSRR